MSEEVKESSTPAAVTEAPSYQPPAHEPQGLESGNAPEEKPTVAETPAAETKTPTVKLPASIKPPVKTGRFQERISDLVSQRDGSKREAEQLREELSRMRGSVKPGEPVKTAAPDGTLNPEDFPTYGDYVTALVKSTLEQKAVSEKSERAKEAYETHKQECMATFNEHAAPLAAQYGEGFWDAISDPTLAITEAMADAVLELNQLGPYTMLYLAAHRDEAKRISTLNPRAATIAIGQLAARLDAELKQGGDGAGAMSGTAIEQGGGTPQTRPTPVPIPRGSSPALNGNAPNDKDSVDDWLRKETDRLRRINPHARFYGAR